MMELLEELCVCDKHLCPSKQMMHLLLTLVAARRPPGGVLGKIISLGVFAPSVAMAVIKSWRLI